MVPQHSRGDGDEIPMSEAGPDVDGPTGTRAQAGYRRALCCRCGHLRSVKVAYRRGHRGEGSMESDHSDPRCLIELKCHQCREVTIHAYLRDFDQYADRAEWSALEYQERVAAQLRQYQPYDPVEDAATRWPDWVIQERRLTTPEQMRPANRAFYIDMQSTNISRRWALAHAIGHLDARHHETARQAFTPAEERLADRYAAIRLGMDKPS